MKVQARLNNYRHSDKKIREIAPLIKGLTVEQARLALTNLKKGCGQDLLKLLESAVAGAKNNFDLKEENLTVENLVVQQGKVLKRWRPRARGSADRILKRTCHVVLTLTGSEEKLDK